MLPDYLGLSLPLCRSVSVNEGAVADLVGNLNSAGASLTVLYRPTSSGLEGLAVAANVVFGGLMASCLGANYLVSWLHPFAPGGELDVSVIATSWCSTHCT